MNDNYSHVDSNVMYVEENIPGPKELSDEYSDLISAFNSQLTSYCHCNPICVPKTCCCMQKSGGRNYTLYSINAEKKLKINFKPHPVIECNISCKCSINCTNRYVQNGPVQGLAIQKCNNMKGMGIFTEKFIPNGTFICEYAGEVITKSQALARHKLNERDDSMNYIYCLNEYSDGIASPTFVDPSKFGNIGRYINHSCEPNCQIVPVRVDSPIPKLAIFNCVDLLPGTEITFNYGSHNVEKSVNNINFATENIQRTNCLCGSARCRGLMPFELY